MTLDAANVHTVQVMYNKQNRQSVAHIYKKFGLLVILYNL